MMNWTGPTFSIGWFLALGILILDVLLKVMGLIDLPVAMVIAALCSIRL